MKNRKGITLVALVITVIILLILAGITINLTIGQNGIIQKALNAKENTIKAAEEEEEALNKLWTELEDNKEGSFGGSVTDDKKDEIIENLKEQMEELQEKAEELENLKKELEQTNATDKHILLGYKAYSGGQILTGTIPDRGAISYSLNAGESYTIPEGYHNGNGVVIAKGLASQLPEISYHLEIHAEGWTATNITIPKGYTKLVVENTYNLASVSVDDTTVEYNKPTTFNVTEGSLITVRIGTSSNKNGHAKVTLKP